MIKSLLKNIIPTKYWEAQDSYYHLYLNNHAGTFYSQEGEDILLSRIFGKQRDGFYVDVGAHHPRRFSNTYHFYKKGWRGINVDAMPGSMKVFQKLRPNDINLEVAVSEKTQMLTYYMFNEPALNSFSKTIMTEHQTEEHRIVDTIAVSSLPLYQILNEHLPFEQKIDFLSVDVEGFDLQVLESNDWDKYRPRVILVEIMNSSLNSLINETIYQFLVSKGYRLFAKLVHTCIFKIEDNLTE